MGGISMFGITGPVVYLLIFVGKLAEVAIMTLRIVFVGRGMKALSALCGLIEEVLWVIVVSAVLNSIRTDPLAAVMYCAAFTVGIVLGIVIENKIALGLTSMQIVSMAADGDMVGPALREQGFGVTILDGHSVDGTKRDVIFVQLKRRRMRECADLVRKIDPDAVISMSDVRSVIGGYMK